VDKLCHLANNLLERTSRQQTSTLIPDPIVPTVIYRIRTGNRYHVYHRRHRRRIHPRMGIAIASPQQPPVPVINPGIHSSSQATITEPSVRLSTSSSTRDYSGESLVSLYCLFQDNINSSRTPPIV
jgi:hypothetical protein